MTIKIKKPTKFKELFFRFMGAAFFAVSTVYLLGIYDQYTTTGTVPALPLAELPNGGRADPFDNDWTVIAYFYLIGALFFRRSWQHKQLLEARKNAPPPMPDLPTKASTGMDKREEPPEPPPRPVAQPGRWKHSGGSVSDAMNNLPDNLKDVMKD